MNGIKYKLKVIECDTYESLSKNAAMMIVQQIAEKPDSVLGLSTGGTPVGMYKELIKLYRSNQVNFEKVRTFNLDEYVGLDRYHPQSYHQYMYQHLFKHVNLPENQRFIPLGDMDLIESEVNDYEEKILKNGGIDLQILGIGENGHIGFNEPFTPFNQSVHTVKLAESTRRANAKYFSSIEEVPRIAITMGIDTIMRSQKIVLLISGNRKKEAFQKLMSSHISEEFPASILRLHRDVTVIVDQDALFESSNQRQSSLLK
ncbi:glucosamine-6-phosphate deaminase [Jeotgalibacillus terrae]|uniref:Glucosamine-6-phosphate deaminase n=1 Tax=Jeotgalibacillus terrae TaxID=587735 RepID=A0ABW5ZC65_9BACL|nr:glucosamine-6-phosphate deaminase [Jeotgalibacillus terrae]MBM7580131.1 glucosamine-6-phosphate deaminase [Jeotgalibacillus terrae]